MLSVLEYLYLLLGIIVMIDVLFMRNSGVNINPMPTYKKPSPPPNPPRIRSKE